MQLSAYGSQDVYLTGNPQITFFKSVYYRHTNFSIEAVENSFGGEPGFGRTVSCTLSKNGDLVHRIYLEVTLPKLDQTISDGSANSTYVGWVSSIGHALIRSVELQIGSEIVDKHYGEWLEIWSELSISESKRFAYKNMVGKLDAPSAGVQTNATNERTYFIPLPFWFCKRLGSALPLIALQHEDVKLNVSFRNVMDLIKSDVNVLNVTSGSVSPSIQCSVYVDYIYLDSQERRRFTENNHEYLIEQVQYAGEESISLNASKFVSTINFTHPVKELMWTITKDSDLRSNALSGNNLFNFEPNSNTEFQTAELKFNGVNRFNPRKSKYFRIVQPFEAHSNTPQNYIYVYSFAASPEDLQPSGTCNMSALDQCNLQLNFPSGVSLPASKIKIYGINYNILRIMSGMSGLAYTN